VFGAPRGIVGSDEPALFENFLKKHPAGLVAFVGRTNHEIQRELFRRVLAIAADGHFKTANKDVYDQRSTSFVMEMDPDLQLKGGGFTISDLLKNAPNTRSQNLYTVVNLSHHDLVRRACASTLAHTARRHW